FESVAPLAEESRDPRRSLPRAIVGSIVIMGAYFLFISWSFLTGWGTADLAGLVREEEQERAAFDLGARLWGPAGFLVLLAIVNSILAVSIAATNASTRVLFAMGRSGALPRALARVHPRFRTPASAIVLHAAVTLAVGLG